LTAADDHDRTLAGEPARMRAAQYVRMSTDHQRYSTENQAEAIRQYAERHAMTIVRTYADEGKSGLSLEGRDALKSLLADVAGGRADYEAILVYDVSRWGRFQDADESAAYEYQCRRAGIRMVYCAEQFENDGSPVATIIKGLKRAVAGEHSRELSVKVFMGQCRLIELGFRQGGAPGFGLRRRLIDEHRNSKGELHRGERKSLQTDRVILVPGPADEVATVRRVYRLFVDEHRPEREIAELLNHEEIATDLGRPWTRGTVHQLLTNEKYIGHNVFNRVSFKLKSKRVRNPENLWIRADSVYEPIVDPALFARARAIIEERSYRLSDAEMLDLLKRLFDRVGGLSGLTIDEQDDMPSSSTYRSRFGSLIRAYGLVGYRPYRDYRYIEINRALRQLHPKVMATVIAELQANGGTVRRDPSSDLLTINDEFTASVVIARCRQTQTGAYRWRIRLDAGLLPDITVAVRMDAPNRSPLDYYLFPKIDVATGRLRLAEENGLSLDAYRFDALDLF
jgi:DNA invertase Pin-like site-specific DNA recombinase